MDNAVFDKLVSKAVSSLPHSILNQLENVAIVIEDEPSEDNLRKVGLKIDKILFGLYQGIPKTKRNLAYSGVLPDKITIFKGPIERTGHSTEEIEELIKLVVWHEIAHHFGFNEKEVRNLEDKWRQRLQNRKTGNSKKSKVHVLISGRVQGVFLRRNIQKRAQKLNLTGWVKNLPDGYQVEAVFEGNETDIREMIDYLKSNPGLAKIENIRIKKENCKDCFKSFDIF